MEGAKKIALGSHSVYTVCLLCPRSSLYDITTLMLRCQVGEDGTTLFRDSVGAYFVLGSHCVFVTSRYLSINTRFNFSGTRFGFNYDAVSLNPQNSEFLLPRVLL